MVKKYTTKKKNAFVALILSVALIAGVFAFMTAQDSKINKFTIGNVKIQLIEEFDTNQDGDIEEDGSEKYTDEQPPVIENIMAGQEVIKRPWAKNTGINDEWVFLVVQEPVASQEQMAEFASTGDLPSGQQHIYVTAYAFQDNYKGLTAENGTVAEFEAMWEQFGADLDGNGHSAVATPENYTPIFTINGINTTDWLKIESASFVSDDGSRYTVYAYNAIVGVNAETSNLFESVEINDTLGSEPAVIDNPCKFTFVDGEDEIAEKTVPLEGNVDVPSIAGRDSVKYVSENGTVVSSGTQASAKSLAAILHTNGDITYADEVVCSAIHDNDTDIVKLKPKVSGARVERNGIVETILGGGTKPDIVGIQSTNIVETNNGYDSAYRTENFDHFFVYFNHDLDTFLTVAKIKSQFEVYSSNTSKPGSFEVIQTLPTPIAENSPVLNHAGTGSLIVVKDSDGFVREVFSVVLFGDVNCNAFVSGIDDSSMTRNLSVYNHHPTETNPEYPHTVSINSDNNVEIRNDNNELVFTFTQREYAAILRAADLEIDGEPGTHTAHGAGVCDYDTELIRSIAGGVLWEIDFSTGYAYY